MMYLQDQGRTLAISQPAHAVIAGTLLRRLAAPSPEALALVAGLHDLAWLDWEVAPPFDPETGRPPMFRHLRTVDHAPMWTRGVDQALAAWGPHAALLISRHGGRIYRRYVLKHAGPEDDAAVEAYLAAQAPREAAWAQACGLDGAELERQSTLLALVDALSLAVCGALSAPAELELPDGPVRLVEIAPRSFALAPWPFTGQAFEIEGEGRPLPPAGRFANEAEMRAWLASPQRDTFRARLAP